MVNVAGPASVALADLIGLVETVTGRAVPQVGRDRHPGDVDATAADLSHAAALLGYRPRVHLLDGLRRQWAWLADLLPASRSN